MKKMKIATYLVKEGYISLNQANKIIEIQKGMPSSRRQRFGRIAINNGFIAENILNKVLLKKEKKEFGVK